MPIFLERVILPLFVLVVFALAITNPMGFDVTQRITGGLALLLVAYFLAHTIHKKPAIAPDTPYSQRANIEITSVNFPVVSDPFKPGTSFCVNVRAKNIGPIPANRFARFLQNCDIVNRRREK